MIDFLTTVLFESLPWLLVFCAAALAVALAVHRRKLTPAGRRGIWITLAGCGLLVLIQRLVVTDRELLDAAVRAMVRAADEGDVEALGAYVAPTFRWRSGGRQEFLDDVNSRLTATRINGARVTNVAVKVNGDSATVGFSVVCDLHDGSNDQPNVPSFWELRFVRLSGRWLMEAILKGEIRPGGLAPTGGIDLMPMIR